MATSQGNRTVPAYPAPTAGPSDSYARPAGDQPPFEFEDTGNAQPSEFTDSNPLNRHGQPHGHPNAYQTTTDSKPKRRISKKTQQRLYWIIPLLIILLVLAILFEVYKSSFERWVSPLADWLRARESWSWVIPVAILFVLSFPPLFGHEIVQIVVGLTYPLGVAIGIACAGAILGEAGCFVVFKYGFTGYVERRIAQRVRWAAIARITREAGYRGILVIRYSIVPPHLANPLFSCTGITFWVYMSTVVLSLPKSIVFVALGAPSSENSKGGKIGKVIAIAVVVIITVLASRWIRKKLVVATKEIEAERAGALTHAPGDEEMDLSKHAPK